MATTGGPNPETNWYKVYEWDTWNDVGTFSYTINKSSTAPSFTRILYIFRLGNYSTWIELDDFTSNNANRIGVPLTWVYEVNVTNLIVRFNRETFPDANNSTIYNRNAGVNGRINFWPSNYGTTGENNSLYDSDDDSYDTGNGYGSMQFFDVSQSPSHCMFSWSFWGGNNGGILGMGNRSTSHPDWTFSDNFNTIRATGVLSLGQVWVK
jgi:hypothetical protein